MSFSVQEYWPQVSAEDRETLRGVLEWDVTSEFDARFLSRHLRSLDIPLSPSFLERERHWADDEQRHFEGFRAFYEQLFGDIGDTCQARRPDFAPVAHLFDDEFAICCLLAYDELTTIRGFRANLALYDQLGPQLGAFVRNVIADEGRHYGSFAAQLRTEHPHRLDELADTVARIRATEGIPYASTFVLDHDEDLYTDELFDESARILLAHAEGWARRCEAVR